MSERTTIGGTVYEAIGSSSSNLLLKCNGTARIQWGGKLIDLIKNGKIASEGSLELIFIIKDESEIKSDGIYVLTTEESDQLWVCKDGVNYNLTVADLYISASNPQNLTGEQKYQALQNIGMYYNTLQDLLNALIQNGLVYVLDSKTLYMIQNGVIEEFKATIKDVTVDKELEMGDVINGSVKLVLSVQNEEYLVLADHRITANYSIHVRESAQIGSEEADINLGYRLYISGGVSHLDVDEINVRNGIKIKLYKEITFENFASLLNQQLLEPLTWYLITDFLNHWKLTRGDTIYNRPILVRAFDEKSTYKKGYLFRDHNIVIHYDPFFQDPVKLSVTVNGVTTEKLISARGKITWMKDYNNNNEANFDFLDYTDCNGKELAVLHYPKDDKDPDKSIFPKHSHDNKLKVYNLKGTNLKEGILDDTNTTSIDFQFDDSKDKVMEMYGNDIECRGLVLKPECTSFCNNILRKTFLLEISNIFNDNKFLSLYKTKDYSNINYEKYTFENFDLLSLILPIEFKFKTERVIGEDVRNCFFSNELINSSLGSIENCNFNQIIENSAIILVKRPAVTYFYNFKKLLNSTINDISLEVEFPEEIKDSFINIIKGKVQILKNITECNIETIASNVTINGTLTNSNINEISDNVTIYNQINKSTINKIYNNSNIEFSINNCNINDINNSTIKGNLSDSNFNNITSSTIENGIANSNINDILSLTLKGPISNSNIHNIDNSTITESINNSTIKDITSNSFLKASINKSTFEDISNSTIEGSIYNCIFKDISNCQFYAEFTSAKFKELLGCTFNTGNINNVVSFYVLNSESFNAEEYFLLYNSSKRKEIYIHNGKTQIICVPDVIFYRGMIIMHSGTEEIPPGWAPCDGLYHEWEGKKYQTPNLINKFIKSGDGFIMGSNVVGDNSDTIDPNLSEDNKLKLLEDHLPTHRHPHLAHSHEAGDASSNYVESSSYSYSDSYGDKSRTEYDTSYSNTSIDHTHTIYEATSKEDTSITFKNKPFSIEPRAYKLIFIMKL